MDNLTSDNDWNLGYEDDENLSDIWIYSNSPEAIKWIQLNKTNPSVAAGFYEALFFNKSENLANFSDLSGYLTAYEFKTASQHSFTSRAAAEKEALCKNHAISSKAKFRLVKQARKKIDEFSEWQDEQQDAWAERLRALEFTYQEKLRLEGPAVYWAKKAREHEVRGYVWASILGAVLFFSVVALWTSFNIWLSGDHKKINLSHVEGALIFVALLSTLAFSVRSLSKLAFSAFHLQRDAEEREQLTHLYLTLSKDTEVDGESRKIILQSLFSRSETGLISNESGPTMPGLTDLLSAIKKG
ncbi:DUF6161 domain-containing protein [Pseudomonas sp. 1152_12]|uniref:DUF6161 domain-containing protein n=1 Tax=Pseudomonas sp. 1152_12 TaxID=2604455 RepID=UPI004063560E